MIAFTSSALVAIFALASRVVATPPACLLAAINTQENPADLDKICGEDVHAMQPVILTLCGEKGVEAQIAFDNICLESGKFDGSASNATSPSSSGNATAVMTYTTMSYDSACSCNKTSVVTSTAADNGTGMYPTSTPTSVAGAGSENVSAGSDSTGSESTTGPFTPESTGGAVQHTVGSLAAAVVAVAGVVAVL